MIEKTNKKSDKILKDMSFSELINKYPDSMEVLMNHGMHCFGCAMASFETLEQGCVAHGLDPDNIVEEINKKLENKLDKEK